MRAWFSLGLFADAESSLDLETWHGEIVSVKRSSQVVHLYNELRKLMPECMERSYPAPASDVGQDAFESSEVISSQSSCALLMQAARRAHVQPLECVSQPLLALVAADPHILQACHMQAALMFKLSACLWPCGLIHAGHHAHQHIHALLVSYAK